MTQYIYDLETGDIKRKTRVDNRHIIVERVADSPGKVNITESDRYILCDEIIEPLPTYDSETERLRRTQTFTYLDVEQPSEPVGIGTTVQTETVSNPFIVIDWEIVPIPPQPEWQAFAGVLSVDPNINGIISVASTMAPFLHLMLGVGLGQAAQGDVATFSNAWMGAKRSGFISSEVSIGIASIATTYNLPSSFIDILDPVGIGTT